MSTKVVFDSAVFRDAIKKAVDVAPKASGAAFDKAHGVIIEVMPEDKQVTVRSTDLETFYTNWMECTSIEGEEAMWRLSANFFGGLIKKIKPDREVVLTQDGDQLYVTSGATLRASFSLADTDSYPHWDIFEEDNLVDVSGIGNALKMVTWAAADSSDSALASVHMTGEYVEATNRYKACRFPLKVPGLPEEGITLPMSVVDVLVNIKGDVRFGFDGNSALIMPDDDTQIKAVCFDTQYPNLNILFDIEHTDRLQFNSDDFIHMIDLTSVIAEGDRLSRLTFWLGREQIAAMTTNETDRLRDIMEVPGQATHSNRVEIRCDPKYLIGALSNGEGLTTMLYSSEIQYVNSSSGNSRSKLLRFEKKNGYVALVAPVTG